MMRFTNACFQDACINDAFKHVYMMHVRIMHVSITLDLDECVYDVYIHDICPFFSTDKILGLVRLHIENA